MGEKLPCSHCDCRAQAFHYWTTGKEREVRISELQTVRYIERPSTRVMVAQQFMYAATNILGFNLHV